MATSPFWRRIAYSERFRMMQIYVAADIATYEYDCTGRSRRTGPLTEEFPAECMPGERTGPSFERGTRRRSGATRSSASRVHEVPACGPTSASQPRRTGSCRP